MVRLDEGKIIQLSGLREAFEEFKQLGYAILPPEGKQVD